MQYIYKIIQLECHFKSDALFIYIQEYHPWIPQVEILPYLNRTNMQIPIATTNDVNSIQGSIKCVCKHGKVILSYGNRFCSTFSIFIIM